MAYAILKAGGKQFRVAEGDIIDVDLLDLAAGAETTFSDVLFHADGDKLTHGSPLVSGASVVGVDDERLGQRVAAAVELDGGRELDATGLTEHCIRQLARYKVPERWRICPLPRNAMGKVVRHEVETWFSNGGMNDGA